MIKYGRNIIPKTREVNNGVYISELLTDEELAKWTLGKKIMIKAQTGKGKTHFIFERLIPRLANNELVLVLSNRSLLQGQNALKVNNRNVVCVNYQYVEKMSLEDMTKWLARFSLIFFDECHYFFTDSAFNNRTDKLFNFAIQPNANQLHVFASATPEPLFYSRRAL